VANVNPTVTPAADQTAYEGASKDFALGSFTDPGPDAPWHVDVDWGDGSAQTTFDASSTGSLGTKAHTYADGPATRTVSVKVTDKNGGSDTKTFSVDVKNVAPTVTLSANDDLSVNEGSTHTYSYSISDPGQDTVTAVQASCGDHGVKSSASNTDTSGSFDCRFPDGPDSSTVSASATDSDGATGAAAQQIVAVANVAPTVHLTGAANVDEGSTHTYSFTVTDPGDDTFVASAGFPDCDAAASNNGTLVAGTYQATATGGSFDCSFPDGPSTASVKIKVADSDGASGTDSESVQVVAVANVNPTITAPADQGAYEGASKDVNLGSFTDPGPDSPWHVDVDWGDASTHTTFDASSTGSLGTKAHTYADGPATQTVTVKVTDKNNGSDTKTFKVAVANVAPTVKLSASNDLSANEGTTHTYSYSISDPGQDTVQSVQTDCGTGGTKVAGSDHNTDAAGSFQCAFPDGPASSDVTASATDSDNATGAKDTQTVSVVNVAPTVHVAGLANVDEGSTHQYTFTVTDPGRDEFISAGGTPDCDAGATNNGTLVAGSYQATATGGSFDCSFPDGPSTANVKMQVIDSDGAGAADSESVQVVDVANVNPTITPAANQSAPEGASKSIDLGSFADPGSDSPWAVDVDWGDGSTHTTFSATATGGLGSQAHIYADGPAAQTVTVKVTDKDGASDSKTFTVNVTNGAPKVTLSTANDRSVNEGTTHTYSYSISDPGQDTVQSVQPDCGDRGTLVSGSSTNDNTSGSFKCSFADGLSPATATSVSVSAKDSDGDTGAADSQSVTVNNVAPTATAAADQTATEGSSQSFTLGSFDDPGTDSPWKVAVSWGDSATSSPADRTATGSLGSASHTYADNGAYTVSVTVTDKDGSKDTKTFKVAVANVGPTITSFSGTDYLAGANAFVGGGGVASTLTTRFTDPGADSWTGAFTYQDGSPLTETKSPFVTGQQVNHTFASSGCKSASVKVTDDDGGYDTASTTIKVGTGAFQPPMTNQPVTDKLKNGQVLPVKVHVNDCSGAAATTLTPAIRLVKGDLTPQSDDTMTTITPTSTSAADTTGVMRSSGGGDYMYNMQVNLATLNTDYTVVVYPYGTGSTVELGHVIQATK
jgi:hypothetical protein